MKYIYIAGPYTKGDVVKNVHAAIIAAENLIERGYIPYVPHLTHFWHFAIHHNIEFWYKYDLAWLAKCDALLRLPGESHGADEEIRFAKDHNIKVYYDIVKIPNVEEEMI